jgi:hypothetical protein
VTDRAAELRELAHELRVQARGDAGRPLRAAANELDAIARAIDAGGAVCGGYVVVPLDATELEGAPIPPPECDAALEEAGS